MRKVVRNGKTVILRNPEEKAKRFKRQLESGLVRETGEVLTSEQVSYRKGYLSSHRDSKKAWYATNKIKANTQAVVDEFEKL